MRRAYSHLFLNEFLIPKLEMNQAIFLSLVFPFNIILTFKKKKNWLKKPCLVIVLDGCLSIRPTILSIIFQNDGNPGLIW